MNCPSCGREVPAETGQHALVPSAGVVTCPHCGATVTLDGDEAVSPDVSRAEAAPPGRTEGRNEDALEETIAGVREELAEKEGGPR